MVKFIPEPNRMQEDAKRSLAKIEGYFARVKQCKNINSNCLADNPCNKSDAKL